MKDADREHYETYLRHQQMVVDRVTGIVNRRHNGLYVWGETGVGKTFSIERTLEEAQARGIRSYLYFARLSPRSP